MTQAQELHRLGLMSGYAAEGDRWTPRQMEVFRRARLAGKCAAVAYGEAKRARA